MNHHDNEIMINSCFQKSLDMLNQGKEMLCLPSFENLRSSGFARDMYAYSDETNTLLFLGFYDGRIGEGNTGPQISADFEALYNEHFSRYYSLDG